MHDCECDLCKRSRLVREVQSRRNPDELVKTIDQLMDQLLEVEEELSWREAVLDGTWPSAVEQLEVALERARKHREKTRIHQ